MSCAQLPFYVMVQLAGSVLACLSVNGVMRPREEHFYGTAPMPGQTRLPFLLELLASAVLMIVIATAARGSVRTCEQYLLHISDRSSCLFDQAK